MLLDSMDSNKNMTFADAEDDKAVRKLVLLFLTLRRSKATILSGKARFEVFVSLSLSHAGTLSEAPHLPSFSLAVSN